MEPRLDPHQSPALAWTEEGAPRSQAFDDIYFQPGEGLGESRAVFLQGCGLPEAWRGRPRFVVGELGFGAGLNILALLELWRRERSPGQQLNVFSIEAYPLAADEARRALAAWPELADLAAPLLAAWPRRARGFHRIDLPEEDAVIDLAVGEAAEALRAWTGRADAWFLDGFSPAKNPQMWRDEVLALVAERSAPGARAATFTVAGHVRRGLAAAGFEVERLPGHGRKRQRLEARLPGPVAPPADPGWVVVVGGGIAGASLVRALRRVGLAPLQIAPDDAGASGNPAALVTPGLDAGAGAGGRLYAQAAARAVDLYHQVQDGVIARGVVQLEREARDGSRFDRIAASDLFAPGALTRLDAPAAAERLHEAASPAALMLEEGLVIEPAVVLAAWSADRRITETVHRIERDGGVWRLWNAAGDCLAEAETVCLAAGPGLRAFTELPLGVVRGQASWATAPFTGSPGAWGGYAIPTRQGVLFGATHDRGDEDLEVRAEDHARNLSALAAGRPELRQALADAPLAGRAALRVTTRDRLPAAGGWPGADGLYMLVGLGSRGFTTAPLLAEHVAALLTGGPSPLPADVAAAVAPARLEP